MGCLLRYVLERFPGVVDEICVGGRAGAGVSGLLGGLGEIGNGPGFAWKPVSRPVRSHPSVFKVV